MPGNQRGASIVPRATVTGWGKCMPPAILAIFAQAEEQRRRTAFTADDDFN